MSDSRKIKAYTFQLRRHAWALAVAWTIIVSASLLWDVFHVRKESLEAARIHARGVYEKDVIYRRWNTGHGGVYVPVTEETLPNPYLSDMPERDITTLSGKPLTLMNPAYMTRQAHELMEREYSVRGHITSLRPIRPENAPDPWETEVLQAFQRGQTEASSVEEIEDKEYMRLMRPLFVEKGCLKCHAKQGYAEGDIRGGISASIPMAPLLAISRMHMLRLALIHCLLWLIGIGGIAFGAVRLGREEREREQAAEDLRASEEKYRGLVEDLPVLVCIFDPDYTITFVDEYYCREFGRSRDELIGHTFLSLIPESDRQVVVDNISALTIDNPVLTHEHRVVTPGGEIRWQKWTNRALFDQDGKLILYHSIGEDITERRLVARALQESESRYRSFVENFHGIAYRGNMDFSPMFLHGSVEEISGYTSDEFVSGKLRWDQIIHPDDMPSLLRDVQKVVSVPGFSCENEYRIIRKDGQIRWIHEINQNICDDSGKPVAVQGVLYDITERKRMQEELLKVEKLESIGVLAGGIAHDLNNLLTGVVGNISLAKMYEDPSEKDRRLTEAENAAMRIKDLTQQLLTFSRGGMPIRQTADIAGLLKDSVAFTLSGSNVRCDFSIPDDLWPVEIDEGQINQVINNLVINARQAMPTGGIVEVCAENVNIDAESGIPLEDGAYIKVSIQDEGTGISNDHIQKIFDPFFTTKQEGNGLGLATSYSIIQKHNGHITVESELGVGATFHIYLPASPEETLIEGVEEEVEPIMGAGRILVMDDEKLVRELASGMLTSLGYRVTTVTDGAQAIEAYREAMESGAPYDAVIMDLTVPGGMGGEEAIGRLTEIDPAAKVIVSSGYSNDPIMANFGEYGFKAFIPKPYKVGELSEVLHNVITEMRGQNV